MLRAVAVLALVVVATASQPPSPAPAKAAQSHQNQTSKVHGEAGADQPATGSASPARAQPGAVATTGNQYDRGSVKKGHPATNGWEIAGTIAGIVNTILLTLFSGALAVLAYRQWLAMDRQAKLMHRQAIVMRRQLAEMKTTSTDTHNLAEAAKNTAKATANLVEVTQRAWIAVEPKLNDSFGCGVGFYPEGDIGVSIRCAIKNVGHSVANNIELRLRLVFLKPEGFGNASDIMVSQIQSKLAADPPYGQLGVALFPGEPGILIDWLIAGKADFEDALHDPDEGSTTPRIVPIVVGCVVYEYPNSPIHHTTRFAYHIYHQRPRLIPPPPYQPGIDVGVTLQPPDEIAFVKYFVGAGAD